MEASKLSDIEFKRMVIRMIKELTDNYKELSENYKSMRKERETINNNQEVMKNTISGGKTHLKELQAGWMKHRTELVSCKTR